MTRSGESLAALLPLPDEPVLGRANARSRGGGRGVRSFSRRYGWLLLLALAPIFLFFQPRFSPALLAVPALLALQTVGAAPRAGRTPLDWPLLLLAVMLLVSLWVTFSIAYSATKIAGLVFGLGLYYALVAGGRGSPRVLGVMTALHLSLGAGLAALALLETRWMDKFPLLTAITARLPAAAVAVPGAESGLSPNGVAGVLLWTAPPALALAAAVWLNVSTLTQTRGRRQVWLAGIGLTGLALGTTSVLVLTQSRSALAGLAAALVAMPALGGAFGRGWRPRLPSRRVLIALVVTLLIALAGLGGWLWSRGPGPAAGAAPGPGADLTDGGLAARILIWPRALNAIEDFPITGMGLYTFQRLANVLYPPFGLSPDITLSHAHNVWLQVALDLGLPGLVADAAVWLLAALMLLQALRSAAASPGPRALALGLLGALAASFVYGLTDTIVLGARPGFLWWMLLALATLVYLHVCQRSEVGSRTSEDGTAMLPSTSDFS